MAICSSIALLSLHLEYDDLLVLALLNDLALNGSLQISSSLDTVIVCNSDDLIKCDLLTGFASELLYEDLVALGNLLLLAACQNNCIPHKNVSLLFIQSRCLILGTCLLFFAKSTMVRAFALKKGHRFRSPAHAVTAIEYHALWGTSSKNIIYRGGSFLSLAGVTLKLYD